MRKTRLMLLALTILALGATMVVPAFAEEPAGFVDALKGTYEPLFPVMTAPEYDEVWLEACTAAVGEEGAQAAADMLKAVCLGELYGQEAIDAYAENPEAALFNCDFQGGVATFTFDGTTFSGVDEAGAVVFSHTYAYVGTDETLGFYQYMTEDADAGEFTYFAFAPDTMAETYHIEFRYGSDLDAMSQFYEGPYAYWLAAGISTDRTDETMADVITLFCTENLSEGAE